MSHPSLKFQLAPAAILRAAAWPIESIEGFGNPELARLALTAIPNNHDGTWQEYIKAYEQTHEQERQRLWEITAADSRFMKALLLSNPSLVAQIQRVFPQRQGKRTKTIRHLETALYRYLARATGRTTPYGLWAGVSLAKFGETAQQHPAMAEYLFTPDLRPFQTMLRSLSGRSHYRQITTWRLNPTLERQIDGTWNFCSRTKTGLVESREIASGEIVDILLDELAKIEIGTLAELSQAIAAASPERKHLPAIPDILHILHIFIDGGVLLGGLDLPYKFENPWQALTIVEDQLIDTDRYLWNKTIQKLQQICDVLGADLPLISLEAVSEYLQQAKICIQELVQSLDISVFPLPEPVLHCDFRLPFQITINQTQQSLLLNTLREYESCWINSMSPASAFRIAFREQIQQEFQPGRGINQLKSTLTAPMINVNHPQIANQIEKWEKLLSQNTEEVVLETNNNLSHSASPFGCLFTGLFASFQLVVYGINDDAVRSFARFSDLIQAKDSLHPWFQEKLDYLITQYPIQIAEIQGPFEANPNVLARPKFNQILPIELWGASRETPSLTGAKIFIDQKTQLPFLKLLSLTTPVAVFGFSLAAIASGDHISQQLLWTTFQDNPGAIFRATTLPMSIELTTPRFTPSIRLPTQAIIRPRRTVLRQEILAELIDLPEIKRFARWQKLASEHGWPILLNLQIEGKPPLLLHRDSPLALESLFKKDLREQTRWLIIEELVNPPWLVDQEGKHYMAELAIPFARTEHGWSSLKREFL